jgi:hypothetical protein
VVDDVRKRREPLPQLLGIYFIAPTDENIKQLTSDFALAAAPQYKAAHIFFSSKPAAQQLAALRECPGLVSRLRTLKEVRLSLLDAGAPECGQLSAMQARVAAANLVQGGGFWLGLFLGSCFCGSWHAAAPSTTC